jgi:L-2,4-diaminobutyrate decarboxylase
MPDPTSMHRYSDETERVAQAALAYARERLRLTPVPLDGPRTEGQLETAAGQTITAAGLGGDAALRLFADVLAHATVSVDNPRYLAFIPAAPTEYATLFDLVVAASSIYGGSWLESAGATYAENQALRWVADLAGLPDTAGGCFVQGGTVGNLSALVAARHAFLEALGGRPDGRLQVAATHEVHSSIVTAAQVMDVDVIGVATDAGGRMSAAALEAALEQGAGSGLFAAVATAGTTNLGVIDDLAGIARVCERRGIWFHVDAAYGGAALAAPSVRARFDGIERCDSFIVDPHKWLFAPYDCCALVYRRPEIARAAHAQHAGYLEPLQGGTDWNPSDYAVHLSRRSRGLPFWFSLAAHGTDAYREAIEHTLAVAGGARAEIESRPHLELVNDPDLTVLCIRRMGWGPDDYRDWSARLLREGTAFIMPTTVSGEVVTRIAIVNPGTTRADIAAILDTMA